MKSNLVSWTKRCEDGVKREVRVHLTKHTLKWQYKRADEEHWDYDSAPTNEDWDALEDVLKRRAGRGRAVNMLDAVRKLRKASDA